MAKDLFPIDTYKALFSIQFIEETIVEYGVTLVVYDPDIEEVVLWTK